MRNVLILLPSLEPSAAGRQALLLARGLPRDRFRPRVAALVGGPFEAVYRSAGVPTDVLGTRAGFDLTSLRALVRLLRDAKPDVLHAWRWPAAAVAVALARWPFLSTETLPRLIVSEPLRDNPGGPIARAIASWWLAGVRRVVAGGPAEAASLRAAGLPDPCLVVVPPGVEPPPPAPDRAATLRALGLPETCRLIVAAGRFDAARDFRTAVWAADILRYRFPDVRLLLCGDGPLRSRVAAFARHVMGEASCVRFAGWRDDLPALLRLADVVWVTDRAEGGRGVALEAMAAGRPVILTNRPGLAELLATPEAGTLVATSDKVALARQTYRLFTDTTAARHAGEAARTLVGLRFSVPRLVEGYARLYDNE